MMAEGQQEKKAKNEDVRRRNVLTGYSVQGTRENCKYSEIKGDRKETKYVDKGRTKKDKTK